MSAIHFWMDEWELLRAFSAVARAGSFSAAATELRVSQSTVSRHVAKLEGLAGLPLFDRRGTKTVATEAGTHLLRVANDVELRMHDFERVLRVMGREEQWKRVCVAAPPEIAKEVLAPRLAELLQDHPALQIDLVGRATLDSLTSGEVDMALRLVTPLAPGLVRRRVLPVRYRLYGTAEASQRKERVLVGYHADLAHIPEARMTEALVADGMRVVVRANTAAVVAEACAASVGVAVLAEPLMRFYPNLKPLSDVLLTRSLYLVMHQEVARLPRIRAVASWIERCLAPFAAAPAKRRRG